MNVRFAACLNSCRYSKYQTAVETEFLGSAEPGLQVKSTSDVTETLTCVGSDTPAQTIAVDATDSNWQQRRRCFGGYDVGATEAG